ncbi:MAG TPA: SDR family oxidoreductase [Candidatus Limnocylindrales bacterium]|nr:SDR family oxidoreductase [Candidatus Limnocylindrales bacterium]
MVFREDALVGQHILISGGAGGIGVGLVKKLTDHGARMTVNDLLPPEEALARFSAVGVRAKRMHYVRADLTLPEEVERFVGRARAAFGPIHTALCHTGLVVSKPLFELTPADWDQAMAVNVRSAFLLAQAAARAMIADGIAGHLIFTSSWVAEVPWPGILPYISSKAAVNQLMRGMAHELADRGIRANAIAPGIADVGMARRQWDTQPDYRARAQKAIPLGFLQPVESIADAMLFLCSAAASYMTGAVLTVDGGASLYPMD